MRVCIFLQPRPFPKPQRFEGFKFLIYDIPTSPSSAPPEYSDVFSSKLSFQSIVLYPNPNCIRLSSGQWIQVGPNCPPKKGNIYVRELSVGLEVSPWALTFFVSGFRDMYSGFDIIFKLQILKSVLIKTLIWIRIGFGFSNSLDAESNSGKCLDADLD